MASGKSRYLFVCFPKISGIVLKFFDCFLEEIFAKIEKNPDTFRTIDSSVLLFICYLFLVLLGKLNVYGA